MKLNVLKIGAVLCASIVMVTTSCSNEELEIVTEANQGLSKDVLLKAKELNINPAGIEVKQLTAFDGKSSASYVIVDDMAMTKSRFLQISENQLLSKQYRTEFLIDTDAFPTVDVIGFIGEGPLGLSQLAQDGLVAAVENWNQVNSDITLTLTFTSELTGDFENFEIFVNTDSSLSSDGLAEFPRENGSPGGFVRINGRVNANFPDGFEHLMTHEIGHAIGFRHTDWNSRQTCVDLGIEAEASVENNPPSIIFGTLPSIPGILTQDDSIMNACFNFRTTDGELNFNDSVALKFLYPNFY